MADDADFDPRYLLKKARESLTAMERR